MWTHGLRCLATRMEARSWKRCWPKSRPMGAVSMNLYRSPRTLSAHWHRLLETGLEAGDSPVLALGWDTLHPDSFFSVAALNHLSHHRPGAINPWVVAGGEGGLWLMGANQWPRTEFGGAVYGGNDCVTYAASLTLAEPPRSGLDGSAGLPLGMAWMLTPTAAPGSERSEGEYLPFALAPDEFSFSSLLRPLSDPDSSPSALDWIAGAEHWAAILLVLGLLVAAFLI